MQCRVHLVDILLIGDIYNITHYLSFHPGGRNELMKAAGTDCTLLFNQVAIYNVTKLLKSYL